MLGDNGIISKAKDARTETVIGQEKDQIGIAYSSALANNLGDTVRAQDLQQELDKLVGANKTTVTSGEAGTLKILFSETNNQYKVKNGEISDTTEEPEVELTSIYAKLYSYTDGRGDVLVLSSSEYEETSADLTEKSDYGDISGDEYSIGYDEETDEEIFNLPPWIDLDLENGTNKNRIIEVKIIGTIVPKTTACYFFLCDSLQNLNLDGLDTSRVTDMSNMFSECYSLTTLDVSGLDTSNVTNMSDMFNYCEALTTLNVSGFDTSNVTNMSGMFAGVSLPTLDLSGFDTSNVTDMSYMFADVSLPTLDLSNFDTANVTEMGYMFDGCSLLTTLDLSSFDTSNVTYMSGMFSQCSNLTSLNISDLDTSNVTDMSFMFRECGAITDYSFLNNWSVDKVESFNWFWGNMYGKGFACTEIDISNWNINIDYTPADNRTFLIQDTGIGDITLYVKNNTIKELLENNTMNTVTCIVK